MSETMEKAVKWITIVIGLVLIAIFSVRAVASVTDYKSNMARYDLNIAELQKELLVQQAILDESAQGLSSVSDSVHSINDVGVKIAELQTKYAVTTNDYAKSQLYKHDLLDANIQKYQEALSAYFDFDDVYLWFDWEDTTNLTWICLTNYNFTGDTIDVLWVCRGSTRTSFEDPIYAYASALYHVDTGKFTDLRTGMTDKGATVVSYVDDTTDVNGFDFNNPSDFGDESDVIVEDEIIDTPVEDDVLNMEGGGE